MVAKRAAVKIGQKANGKVLDIGAGFGGMFPLLSCFGEVDAYEPNQDASAVLKERGYKTVFETTPLGGSHLYPYDLVGLFDVLEHIEKDKAALENIHALLAKDGVCILTVPALMQLWSNHDVECQHFRRYSASSLRKLFKATGFEIQYMSYWNMTLLLPAYLSRKLGITNSEGETTNLPPLLDTLFSFIVSIESFLIPHISLPFGTGIIVIAKKI